MTKSPTCMTSRFAITYWTPYTVSPTSEPRILLDPLSHALGVRGVVENLRELLIVGQTRIHLNEVQGLDLFVEQEVVLEEAQSSEDGQKIARDLMHRLGIEDGDFVAGAYGDLIEEKGQ